MMIAIRTLISFALFIFVCLPAIVISIPVVAVLLHTKWDGRTTIFGNAKWGRATDHFAYPTHNNFWEELNWLVFRNPVNNLSCFNLAVTQRDYSLTGDTGIGDKLKGGFYAIKMGFAWEYYWIKPYTVFGSRRCIRARIGWKIYGNSGLAAYVFVINPWKKYLGV